MSELLHDGQIVIQEDDEMYDLPCRRCEAPVSFRHITTSSYIWWNTPVDADMSRIIRCLTCGYLNQVVTHNTLLKREEAT